MTSDARGHGTITVEVEIRASLEAVWNAWVTPEDITSWNAASDDWHCPWAEVDFREGGRITSRMEARDGSIGFEFGGTYTEIDPNERIVMRMDDGREVSVEFRADGDAVRVTETFDAEGTHTVEQQREGWQAILDRFARHVEERRNG